MKSKQSASPLINELYVYLIIGIKFGLVGALVGLIVHAIWGTLETILFTMLTGFILQLSMYYVKISINNNYYLDNNKRVKIIQAYCFRK